MSYGDNYGYGYPDEDGAFAQQAGLFHKQSDPDLSLSVAPKAHHSQQGHNHHDGPNDHNNVHTDATTSDRMFNPGFDGLGPSLDDDINVGNPYYGFAGDFKPGVVDSQVSNDNGLIITQSEHPQEQQRPQEQLQNHTKSAGSLQDQSGSDQSGLDPSHGYSNISFNIPGAFKESFNDEMEIDDSPPFTIELDLYFDSMSHSKDPDTLQESLFPHNQYFNQKYRQQIQNQRYQLHNSRPLQSPELQNQLQHPDNISPASNVNFSHVNTPNHSNHNNLNHNNNNTLNTLNTPSADQFNFTAHENADNPSNVDQTPNSNTHQFAPVESQVDDGSIYSSFFNENESIADNNFVGGNSVHSNNFNHLRNPSVDSHYNPPSISINPNLNVNYVNDLSPLTTTTSLTPSINSIHSTQPSFFSAHQYLPRQSIELTNSNRNSVDMYSKTRNSIDSNSNPNQPQRQQRNNSGRYLSFTNSISNYIPFMSDKNNQRASGSPISNSNSPVGAGANTSGGFFDNSMIGPHQSSPTPRQQPKHLIRSIFKSNQANGANNLNLDNLQVGLFSSNQSDQSTGNLDPINQNLNSNEFLLMSPPKEEAELDGLDPLPSKKAKRPKRSLFNRFKTPAKQESNDELDTSTDNASKHSGGNNSNTEFDESNLDTSFHGNMSRTPSSANTVRTGNNVTSSSGANGAQNGTPLDQVDLLSNQPDYAALFENVGKRKKIGKNSTFNKNKKAVSKNLKGKKFNKELENSIDELANSGEAGSGNYSLNELDQVFPLNNLTGTGSSISASTTNTSQSQHLSKEGENVEDSNANPITNASKRILGSKLMKRKVSSKTEDTDSSVNTGDDTLFEKREPDLKDVKTKVIADGVETEVDLKTLDLPDDQQVQPTFVHNSQIRTRGRKENKEADLVDLSKIFLCNYCSRRFKRQEHLKRHFRSLHTFDKPYDCSKCHKKFSRSDNLNQHLKTHKEEEDLELANQQQNSEQLAKIAEEPKKN